MQYISSKYIYFFFSYLQRSKMFPLFNVYIVIAWRAKKHVFTGICILCIDNIYCQVVAIVSCLFVVVSTLCLIFSTLPNFQVKDEEGKISRRKSRIFIVIKWLLMIFFRGRILFWGGRSSFCWMVFFWICHQICSCSSENSVRHKIVFSL